MCAKSSLALAVACAALGSGSTWAADAEKVNWSAVPKSEITLFYPGQASYQFVTSEKHPGAKPDAGR